MPNDKLRDLVLHRRKILSIAFRYTSIVFSTAKRKKYNIIERSININIHGLSSFRDF